MARHSHSDDAQPATLFDKMNDLDEGDDLELLGESLTVQHIRLSAASKELHIYGRREDATTLPPRYEVVLDARHDSFQIFERDYLYGEE